ncbi:hypothetical protein D3C85_1872290 [compost metagenome]
MIFVMSTHGRREPFDDVELADAIVSLKRIAPQVEKALARALPLLKTAYQAASE